MQEFAMFVVNKSSSIFHLIPKCASKACQVQYIQNLGLGSIGRSFASLYSEGQFKYPIEVPKARCFACAEPDLTVGLVPGDNVIRTNVR